jgi:hypothetical protein
MAEAEIAFQPLPPLRPLAVTGLVVKKREHAKIKTPFTAHPAKDLAEILLLLVPALLDDIIDQPGHRETENGVLMILQSQLLKAARRILSPDAVDEPVEDGIQVVVADNPGLFPGADIVVGGEAALNQEAHGRFPASLFPENNRGTGIVGRAVDLLEIGMRNRPFHRAGVDRVIACLFRLKGIFA